MTLTDHATNLHVPWQSTRFLQSTQLVDRHGVIELAGRKDEAKLGGKARLCPKWLKPQTGYPESAIQCKLSTSKAYGECIYIYI